MKLGVRTSDALPLQAVIMLVFYFCTRYTHPRTFYFQNISRWSYYRKEGPPRTWSSKRPAYRKAGRTKPRTRTVSLGIRRTWIEPKL